MGSILGIGTTHFPRLAGPDATMTGTLRALLASDGFPAELREPSAWPAAMAAEYGDDHGEAAAATHRAELVERLRRVRKAIDDFAPDVVFIWGDDQYENFREDVIPPFSVLAYDATSTPWSRVKYGPNVWGRPDDETIEVAGHRRAAKALVSGLIERGFDTAYAYEPLHDPGLAHAFLNTILYLDYDEGGFPYPVVPIAVNCYGRRVISQRGFLPDPSAADDPDRFDPPGPQPWRCFDFGAACARVLRDLPYRAVLIASSSWSHGFLTAKHDYLYPDTKADRRLFRSLADGKLSEWRDVPAVEVEASGQQELLNWFCLAGAVDALGLQPRWAELVETLAFNSNKCFAVFGPTEPE